MVPVEPEISAAELMWLKTVFQILMGRYNQPLLFDTTIMVLKDCPIIDEHVVIIFVTQ